jgi:hypothetical protein
MTKPTPLTESDLTKGDQVAIANPANLAAYLIGIVTETNGKQIVVETDESEFFFAVDGTEKKRGKNRIYSIEALTQHLNAIADAKTDYKEGLVKEIAALLDGATVLRLEKALKLLKGE